MRGPKSSTIAPADLDSIVRQLLEQVADSDLVEARTALAELRRHASEHPQVAAVLDDETSGYFLATFAESYLLIAFATSAVTATLLLLGAAFGDFESPTAGSAVALQLAGGVSFATAVARSGEHRLVRGIFAGPRWLLSIVAVAALAAAASVAFGAEDALRDVVWFSAGGLSLLSCLGLGVGVCRAQSLTHRRQRPAADEDRHR